MILSIDGFLGPLLRRFRFNHEIIALKKNLRIYRRRTNFELLFNNSDDHTMTDTFEVFPKRSGKSTWFEERKIENLPQYLFWPDENRYGKILWWDMAATDCIL